MAVLAIDQGTTSTRAIVFDDTLRPLAMAQQEFRQIYPAPGQVEHDPEDIWRSVTATVADAVGRAGLTAGDIAAIGITNQRETTLIWDRGTGKPIHNAIVWQDRRTENICAALRAAGHEAAIAARTGLVLDPYFSATKIAWLLDSVSGAREAAEAGQLAFGTVDSYLVYRLTSGRVHATDATNAARTLLFDIHTGQWDAELADLFRIPLALLPDVMDCTGHYGTTAILGGAIPIRGVAGDQQAATIGQACFTPGMMKSTYGTGCFALLNTGDRAVASHNRLLTTIAYQIGGKRTYALEGAIFVAGAAVQWAARRAETDCGIVGHRCAGGAQRSGRAGLSGAGLCRARRALLGRPGARCHVRSDPQFRCGRVRARGARGGRLPDPRPDRGHACRLAGRRRHGAARRWRHERQQHSHAISRRHPERAGRPPADHGNNRAGRRLSRRPGDRNLSRF
jgi:sugar (pentulose or hexulose) kinase